ncbi:hypothetical protein Tco_0773849 [Tanacetum coccineum]|uniref:Uncharacterized protein n=1 Tax=Tanacetum coccineum TaxID=301880 RepID=A0ABQ4ZLV4_9ASTR
MANSFAVLRMVIAELGVRATTRSAAHMDNSRLLRWIISMFELNSSVSSTKSSIQSTLRFRLDIMFAVCACARFQVTPKVSHSRAVKRIFRYLKGEPKLGLWYLRDSPFDLVAYFDSDYVGASLDKKSTTGGCQFLGCRLISWQCKKQTVVASSSIEAEYVAAASCCGQVMDIQEKDKIRSQNAKTEHENGKTVRSQKDQVKVNEKVKVKVNPGKWHWKKHRKPNPKT